MKVTFVNSFQTVSQDRYWGEAHGTLALNTAASIQTVKTRVSVKLQLLPTIIVPGKEMALDSVGPWWTISPQVSWKLFLLPVDREDWQGTDCTSHIMSQQGAISPMQYRPETDGLNGELEPQSQADAEEVCVTGGWAVESDHWKMNCKACWNREPSHAPSAVPHRTLRNN